MASTSTHRRRASSCSGISHRLAWWTISSANDCECDSPLVSMRTEWCASSRAIDVANNRTRRPRTSGSPHSSDTRCTSRKNVAQPNRRKPRKRSGSPARRNTRRQRSCVAAMSIDRGHARSRASTSSPRVIVSMRCVSPNRDQNAPANSPRPPAETAGDRPRREADAPRQDRDGRRELACTSVVAQGMRLGARPLSEQQVAASHFTPPVVPCRRLTECIQPSQSCDTADGYYDVTVAGDETVVGDVGCSETRAASAFHPIARSGDAAGSPGASAPPAFPSREED